MDPGAASSVAGKFDDAPLPAFTSREFELNRARLTSLLIENGHHPCGHTMRAIAIAAKFVEDMCPGYSVPASNASIQEFQWSVLYNFARTMREPRYELVPRIEFPDTTSAVAEPVTVSPSTTGRAPSDEPGGNSTEPVSVPLRQPRARRHQPRAPPPPHLMKREMSPPTDTVNTAVSVSVRGTVKQESVDTAEGELDDSDDAGCTGGTSSSVDLGKCGADERNDDDAVWDGGENDDDNSYKVLAVRAVSLLRHDSKGTENVPFLGNGWVKLGELALLMSVSPQVLYLACSIVGNGRKKRFEFRFLATETPQIRTMYQTLPGGDTQHDGCGEKRRRTEQSSNYRRNDGPGWHCTTPDCVNSRGVGCYASRGKCPKCGEHRPQVS